MGKGTYLNGENLSENAHSTPKRTELLGLHLWNEASKWQLLLLPSGWEQLAFSKGLSQKSYTMKCGQYIKPDTLNRLHFNAL